MSIYDLARRFTDPMDQLTMTALLIASDRDPEQCRFTTPVAQRTAVFEEICRWSESTDTETYLTSIVWALCVESSPEQRREMATADPIVALTALASVPNDLLPEPVTGLPSPEDLARYEGALESVLRSYEILTDTLDDTTSHVSVGARRSTTEALMDRVFGPFGKSGYAHMTSVCPPCKHMARVMFHDGGMRGRSAHTWPAVFRDHLPWLIRVFIAAYTGVNPDVVEQMLEAGPV